VTSSDAIVQCRQTLAAHSRSFSLAARLLPAGSRDEAAVLYAWCRRADDAIDEAPPGEQRARLAGLERELYDVYAGAPQSQTQLAAFQQVVERRHIPAHYPGELLEGLRMDTVGQRYQSVQQLVVYCYRVARTVGLMMCHVLGVRSPRALQYAAHLGIAMQLTNICRDVAEDWQRGRLYIPDELLARLGTPGLDSELGRPLPASARGPLSRAIADLLALADRYYRSGDRGLPALPLRAAFAVRTARLVYAAIGRRLAEQQYDVLAGRAIVPTWMKLWLTAKAAFLTLAELPARARRRFKRAPRLPLTRYSDVIAIRY
jgi:phytoene synthase